MKCPTCSRELPDDTGSCPTCVTPLLNGLEPATAETAPGVSSPPSDGGRRFLPGTMLAGRYRIIHVLGQGGMGEVYHADDLVLGQEVALKFLPRILEAYLAQFLLHEVRIARQISHPNVCRVYDHGQAEGLRFLSMEYIDGENLASLLRRVGRLAPERAMAMGREICRGLAAVHDKGILHRDLKPANLMIDGDGRVRITDFGLAALAGTVEGHNIRRGTPAYMAPEQVAGQEVTVKSDLYALGCVLYELTTGVRLADLLAFEPPTRWVDDLDADVDRIIRRCLADDPAERPASAREVAAALGEGAAPVWRPAAGQAIPPRPNWVLERELGRGGFGEVWLAVHAKTGERRVFKFCHDASRLSALEREITLFRLLREELGERDDIVRILDWNFDEPPCFIESEFTGGGDLLEWADAQGGLDRVTLDVRLEIAAQVAEALAAAHSVGVLHKDVKPANVLVHDKGSTPRIRLSDFGIGRVLDASRLEAAGITMLGLTHTEIGGASSSTSGTLLYRAPELFEGKPATVQADIYSLGVMLYQLAVGDPRRALGPGWEHDVDDELLREDIAAAVDRSPRRRLADAAVLATRLRSLEARSARRDAERRQAARTRHELERAARRRRLLWAVLGVALLVISLLAFHTGRIAQEAARRHDVTRVAVAGEWLNRDPTLAALVLLEIERPDEVSFAVRRMRQALRHKLALFEIRHDDDVMAAVWNPTGTTLLTASEDGVLRLSRADGRGTPVELEGCEGTLTSAAWSPLGERFATTCWDGTVRIWRAAPEGHAPAPPRVLEHPDAVLAAAWSPNSERIATASKDGTARVWDLAAGTAVVLRGHTGIVSAAAWSPDGKRLATASEDGTARTWDLAANPPIVPLRGYPSIVPLRGYPSIVPLRGNLGAGELLASRVFEHDGGQRVWTAAWSPDGERLATASNDGTARIWNVGQAATEATAPVVLDGHDQGVRVAAWSPDGDWLLTASADHSARVWSSSTGELLTVLEHGLDLRVAAWSPDGVWILTASEDGTARVWRFPLRGNPGEPIVFAGHDASVMAGGWRPDGSQFVTVSDEVARVWPAGASLAVPGSGEPVVFDRHLGAVRCAAWNGDGTRVLTASVDGTAHIWRADAGEPPVVLAGHRARLRRAAWSDDGTRVVTASEDGTARVWRADGTGLPVVLAGHEEGLLDAAFDPAGERVLTTSKDATARIWRADGTGEPIVLEGHAGPVVQAAWSGDGTRVVTAAEHTVRVWPDDGGSPPIVLEGHRDDLRTVAWSPDDTRILSASYDGTVRIWRADGAGEPIVLDHGVTTPVRTAAFDPSGTRVVTGLESGEVRVWRADGHGEPIDLEGHRFAVFSAVFSPDATWILTASTDRTAQVQRADGTGRPIVLEGHREWIETAAWSPRGDRVVTASHDRTARVWRVPTSDLTALIRASTAVCLDPEFREEILGDSPAEAARRYLGCEKSHGR